MVPGSDPQPVIQPGSPWWEADALPVGQLITHPVKNNLNLSSFLATTSFFRAGQCSIIILLETHASTYNMPGPGYNLFHSLFSIFLCHSSCSCTTVDLATHPKTWLSWMHQWLLKFRIVCVAISFILHNSRLETKIGKSIVNWQISDK